MKPINNFSETLKNKMNLTSIIRSLVSFITSLSALLINELLSIKAISKKNLFNISQQSYICNVLGNLLFTYTTSSIKGAQLIYAVNAPSPFITRTQTATHKNNLKHTI